MKIAALGYSVVQATRPEQWRRFGEDVAGFAVDDVPGGLALRIDERAGRIFVEQGGRDCYFASGWELRNAGQFAAGLDEMRAKGVDFHASTPAERALRHVVDMVWFLDPSGNRHEVFYGYTASFEKFVSPAGVPGFVTDDLGYGHIVLPAPQYDATRDFLYDLLEFDTSDYMIHRPQGADGPAMRIDFVHCDNGRHHSLALFEGTVPSGCVHMMVEVGSMDDVGRAYDRMLKSDTRLMATLGKHTNDHMTSFYMATPGGFALEYGYGGRTIDWDRHTVFESTTASLWGHDFSVGFGADEKAALAEAA